MAQHKNPAAVALGKLGGSVTSPAKAAASRANGKKGGRPMTRIFVTDEMIEALRAEAGTAGDLDMVAICNKALSGKRGWLLARHRCREVIEQAKAAE